MQPAALTAAGLPALQADEVELLLVPRAAFENAGPHRLHLTNKRLMGVSEAPKGALRRQSAPHRVGRVCGVVASLTLDAPVQPWGIPHSLVSVVDLTVRPRVPFVASSPQSSIFRNTGLNIILLDGRGA